MKPCICMRMKYSRRKFGWRRQKRRELETKMQNLYCPLYTLSVVSKIVSKQSNTDSVHKTVLRCNLGTEMNKLRTAECSNIKAWQWQYWCTWQYCDTWPVLVMASQLTSAIFGGLEFTEAEAAFRPWWDTVEDNLVRGLLLMVGVTEIFKRRFSKVIVKSSRTFV